MADYKIEVYSKNGKCLGDIRHLAQGLKWTEQRNAAETVSFRMDLARYEEYVKKQGCDHMILWTQAQQIYEL